MNTLRFLTKEDIRFLELWHLKATKGISTLEFLERIKTFRCRRFYVRIINGTLT